MDKQTLGITVCREKALKKIPPFYEAPYFLQLAQEGKKWGIEVFVFVPMDINWRERTVSGWTVQSHATWVKATKPLPSLIYDRCYYSNQKQFNEYQPYIKRLRTDPQIHLLGTPLKGKLQTFDILKRNDNLHPYLPPTILYQSAKEVFLFLEKYRGALVKPNGGSHGRGVAAILPQSTGYQIRGRDQMNRPMSRHIKSKEELTSWLNSFINHSRYLVQPYLSLYTPDRRPFDIRILIQKNEQMQWEITGMAVRTGKPQSITSNLHGGGEAVSIQTFLETHYSRQDIASILSQLTRISQQVPQTIEAYHGNLVELGLDIGIDQHGRIWILEVNSKPGRTIFIKTGELELRERAVQLPIRYAHALLEQ
ncbi:YheC/YheD family protein [Laceyella putida]|uniref:YheC/YheD family protein n=2 Tax=Laceyella putida TaxID=110101 RepID=A0ABW2RPZ3_9BACL